MAAAKASRLPMLTLVPLQQSPSFPDHSPSFTVSATFFQPQTPDKEEEQEEEEEEDEEEKNKEIQDCGPDDNNNIDVTLRMRTSEPRSSPSTSATLIKRRSTSVLVVDGEKSVPEIIVQNADASEEEEMSSGDRDEDSDDCDRKSAENDIFDGETATLTVVTRERKVSKSVELKEEELAAKIGEYDRVSTVGIGSFGRVILVQHQETKGYYALKIMRIREVIRGRQIEHVHNEKNILLSVGHPFIIKLHWAYHDSKLLYMLFDYASGGELFSYLRCAGRFCNHTAQFYAAEILLAIEYLHSVHVVYRDLKPENILLDKDGHIRLTDFGFAKMLTEGRTFTICGTPEYLAPEVVAGKGHNSAVDWWSLGILIYEMLIGRTPFPGNDSNAVYEQILATRPKLPRNIDPFAKDLIKRLLVINRVKRLGNLKGGAEDVKVHRWFSGVRWDDVFAKKAEPPIKPTVFGDGDTGNFDEYDEDDSSQASDATPDDLELFGDW